MRSTTKIQCTPGAPEDAYADFALRCGWCGTAWPGGLAACCECSKIMFQETFVERIEEFWFETEDLCIDWLGRQGAA